MSVHDLMIPGTYEWDIELISDVFDQRDVREISSIPLSRHGGHDQMIWHCTKNGRYSVKSGYNLLRDMSCWKESNLEAVVYSSADRVESVTERIFDVLQRLSIADAGKFAMLLWALWKHRNAVLWRQENQDVRSLIFKSLGLLCEWLEAKKDVQPLQFDMYGTSQCEKWHCPPSQTYKCNVDAAFFEDINCTGFGMIIWDAAGLSRETTDEQLTEAFNPFGQLVEAKVIRDRATGRSKGFGFVTYTSIEEAEKASEEMNAKFLHGWAIFVDPAKPREREPRPPPRSGPELSGTGFRTNNTVGWTG
ncbi:hypothetical protein PTKIN_Ptkin06aG0027900 [Pterospermum kingtungense]